MRIPDVVLNNVVFVGRLEPDPAGGAEKVVWVGTAFLVSVPCADKVSLFIYLVTVKHIADNLAGKKWVVRFNTKDGKCSVVMGNDSTRWWRHPTEEESVDVAVIQWCPPEGADLAYIPASMFATDEVIREQHIGVGDEVFYTGLFTRHMGGEKNTPIVRTGNLAMLPTEKLPLAKIGAYLGPIDAYLIEVRSMGGLSGSPVFVTATIGLHLPLTSQRTGERMRDAIPVPGPLYLLGMMHGHWNIHPSEHNRYDFQTTNRVSESIALGISVVVPAKKILEVINRRELVELREEWERAQQGQQGTTSTE